MTATIITPWLNHLDLYDDYMAAVEQGPSPSELLIVDNGSDPPLGFAAIRLNENHGFCGGSNAGLEAATSDIVVFLNNDIAPKTHGWLDTLCEAVEPGVLAGQIAHHTYCEVDGQTMPYVNGWCLAGMRDDLLELGGFDDTLDEPAYFSDNLLCLEARAAGMTLREATIGLRHKTNVTAGSPFTDKVRSAFDRNRERYLERARELLAVAV